MRSHERWGLAGWMGWIWYFHLYLFALTNNVLKVGGIGTHWLELGWLTIYP